MDDHRRELFYEKVDRRGSDECWPWQAHRMDTGHGRFHEGPEQGLQLAHRLMYRLERGEIPDGKCVLHACHSAWCVNPSHLYVGDRGDNSRDMVRDGAHGNRKLTDSEVLEMKRRYRENDDVTLKDLGEEYGVHSGYVGLIMEGRRRTEVIADD